MYTMLLSLVVADLIAPSRSATESRAIEGDMRVHFEDLSAR